MSTTTNENEVTKGTEAAVKYEIMLEKPLKFNYLFQASFVTSSELCGLISDFFRGAYADFEGSSFEMIPGTNLFQVCLFFNHKNVDGMGLPAACTKEVEDETVKNSTLRSIRRYDNRCKNGDKFYLTEKGKSGITDFLQEHDAVWKKKDGNMKPNWGRIVQEVANGNGFMYGTQQQYTKVSYIDVNKVLERIYGATDEDGNTICYNVKVVGSVPTYMPNMNSTNKEFKLEIDVISEKNLLEYSQKNGLAGLASNLNIVR